MRLQRRLHGLTPAVAALVGIATHLPGLVYLAALTAIVGSASGPANSVVQVVVYNAMWFSLPIAALVLSAFHPALCREVLERGTAWVRLHRRPLTVAFCVVLGAYLTTKGVLDLHDAAG